MANWNESFSQIPQDYSWTQAGILLVFQLSDPYFHTNDAEEAGGGICSLTISSSPTNVISVAEFLATSTGSFFCFLTPLNFGIFFRELLFKTDCFSPISPLFGMALLLL